MRHLRRTHRDGRSTAPGKGPTGSKEPRVQLPARPDKTHERGQGRQEETASKDEEKDIPRRRFVRSIC